MAFWFYTRGQVESGPILKKACKAWEWGHY